MPIVPRKEIELSVLELCGFFCLYGRFYEKFCFRYAHVLLVMKEIRTLNAGSILAKAPVAVSMLNVKEEVNVLLCFSLGYAQIWA